MQNFLIKIFKKVSFLALLFIQMTCFQLFANKLEAIENAFQNKDFQQVAQIFQQIVKNNEPLSEQALWLVAHAGLQTNDQATLLQSVYYLKEHFPSQQIDAFVQKLAFSRGENLDFLYPKTHTSFWVLSWALGLVICTLLVYKLQKLTLVRLIGSFGLVCGAIVLTMTISATWGANQQDAIVIAPIALKKEGPSGVSASKGKLNQGEWVSVLSQDSIWTCIEQMDARFFVRSKDLILLK